ncbi:MAG: hypothetical protein B7733_00555, partial [Myxococcales bacterium FL481]
MSGERSPQATSSPLWFDFDALMDNYRTGLVNKLRGFGAEAEYLDVWVPDSDTTKSLLNLVEAVALAGGTSLRLQLKAATAVTLRRDELLEALAQTCKTAFEDHGDRVIVSCDNIDRQPPAVKRPPTDAAPVRSTTPRSRSFLAEGPSPVTRVYDDSLAAVAIRETPTDPPREPRPSERSVSTADHDASLVVYVERETHRVTMA